MALTNAERQARYRERQKEKALALKEEPQLVNHVLVTDAVADPIESVAVGEYWYHALLRVAGHKGVSEREVLEGLIDKALKDMLAEQAIK